MDLLEKSNYLTSSVKIRTTKVLARGRRTGLSAFSERSILYIHDIYFSSWLKATEVLLVTTPGAGVPWAQFSPSERRLLRSSETCPPQRAARTRFPS